MPNSIRTRQVVTAFVLLILVLVLAGCSIGQPRETEATTTLLPRLTISIDEQGSPTVAGIALGSVGRLLGQDISALQIPPDLLQQLMAGDIQHIELIMTKEGLLIFVNGKPMPYLAADQEKLANLGPALTAFNVRNANLINFVLTNLISRIGLPVVLKFPVAPGNAEIPLRTKEDLNLIDVEQARSQVSDPVLKLHLDVGVDAQGGLTIAGIPLSALQDDLGQAGVGLDLSSASIDPARVAAMTAAGVQNVQIETEPEGLYLYMNGAELPRVTWDAERLQNFIDVYSALSPDDPNLARLKFLQPYLQAADVELTLMPPMQPGAQEIPPRSFLP
jgi:hypothetical protein